MRHMKKYIAYGSNLNIGQMKKRCPNSKVYDTAVLKGYRLEFRGKTSGGHLTIAKAKDGDTIQEIPVVIWNISRQDEKSLDRYEGYPKYYIKENIKVEADAFGETEGMAYVMEDGFDINCPLGNYVETCKVGYEQFDFDIFPLYTALADAVREKTGDEYYRAFLGNAIGAEGKTNNTV